MRKRLQLLPAIWLVLLLALPATAWLLGARQPILEGRPKAAFPAINRSSLADPTTFERLDAALLDRFPGRGWALDLHARVAIDLFKDSPSPYVAIGRNGWLYYLPELDVCRPGGAPSADPADAAELLARTLVAAGKRTVVTMPPSKLFVHPQDAPTIDREAERCARDLEQRVARRLAETPGGLTLDADLAALEDAGKPVFLMKDTHWNWRGRELFARRILDAIRPGLADEVALQPGYGFRRPGDLWRLLGRGDGEIEDDRAVYARRPPANPTAAGDVVLVGDSQMEWSMIVPTSPSGRSVADVALPGALFCTWEMLSRGECNDEIAAAKIVVVEKVARDTPIVTAQCWIPIFVASDRLHGRRAAWERLDGRGSPAGGVEVPDAGRVMVRVRLPAGRDRIDVPRLLRFSVEHLGHGPDAAPVPVTLTQRPRGGDPAPCATPAQGNVGGSLLLPVPRGRRASDLVVQLSGAPGARIGAPEEIVLDRTVARRAAGSAG